MLSMTYRIIIVVIIVIVGLIYMMKDTIKDTLFSPKQVTFNPSVKQINEDGTKKLLVAAKINNVKKFIFLHIQ